MAKDYITIEDLGMKVGYVRFDRVLEIVDKWTDFALKGNGFMTALGALRNEIKALKGGEQK